jgi:uncharacterized protein YkwD
MGRIAATRRRIAGTGVSLLVVALFLGGVSAPASAATELERQMLRLTNASRAEHDVGRLRLDDRRSTKAHRHSADMAEFGDIYHTVDAARFYLRGMRWTKWGENVGRTSGTLARLQRAFMASPVHRENILDPRFDRVAVGVVERDGEAWVTLFFYG